MSTFGRRLSKAESVLAAAPLSLEAKMERSVDDFMMAARAASLPLSREKAERLVDLMAESDDPCQWLIDTLREIGVSVTPEQVEARLQENERYFEAA